MSNITNKDREYFVEEVVKDFQSKINGEGIERLVGCFPDERFLVGKLIKAENTDTSSSRININQIELDFFVSEREINNTTLRIQPKGQFYYRVLPTLEEQQNKYYNEISRILPNNYIVNSFEDIKAIIEEDSTEMDLKNTLIEASTKIEECYKRILLHDDSFLIELNLNELFKTNPKPILMDYNKKLTQILVGKIDELWKTTDVYRPIRDSLRYNNILDSVVYDQFLDHYLGKDSPKPNWEIALTVKTKKIDDRIRITVSLINNTESDTLNQKKKEKAYSKILFNAGLEVSFDGTRPLDFKLNHFLDNYKYDSSQKAIASNCSHEYLYNENKLITQNIPLYRQKKLKTKNTVSVRFRDLMDDPISILNDVLLEMNRAKRKWENEYEKRKDTLVDDEKALSKAQEKYKEEVQAFEMEINRFSNGIDYLKTKDFVMESFIRMNETFANTSDKYDSWRLFQIVFIVSIIPDIITSEYGEEIENTRIGEVDLLYFPTGGGKTEAFLGLTVFTLFFDRIRGKKDGVSAIIKYPLRLLSIQQADRLAGILASAELIRKRDVIKYEGAPFSIGYFVGDKNTPNRISKESSIELSAFTQDQIDDKYRILDVCPFCGNESVHVVYDDKNVRLKHICLSDNCSSGGVLPIYIVDNEIYRYLPSVLISTIDKIAAIGVQSKFRNILGEVTHRCPAHGYTSSSKCIEKDTCVEEEFEEIHLKDPAPSLIIQDEIHLIRESLGTFNAHYETLFQYMVNKLIRNKKKFKVVGATATISEYKNQIWELYFKGANRFPCEVPNIREDFYSKIDDDELNRIIIGYAPFGKAIINAVVYSMKYLREIIYDYYINPQKVISIPNISIKTEAEAKKIIEEYWIFLQYNNIKFDSNRVIGAIESPINTELESMNIPIFQHTKMTGDDSFQDVRKTLKIIETTKNVFDGLNLISATSMISHGVDASKFNIMFFFGMPGNTAEYIQAYSRAGRQFPGIVIDIFRPTRERDRSYLNNFNNFHNFKDILVEQVPINRWAYKAIEKTFSGILTGLLINHYDLSLQYEYGNTFDMKKLKQMLSANVINKDELTKHIIGAYKCEDADLGTYYKKYIVNKVNEFYAAVSDLTFSDNYHYITSDIDRLGIELSRPMYSLRDTDKSVQIELE